MHLRPIRFQLSPLLLGLLLTPVSQAQTQSQVPDAVIAVPNPPNTRVQQTKHFVVLVSLDGFRYDYVTRYNAAHRLALAARGASAPEGMLPSYPIAHLPQPLLHRYRPLPGTPRHRSQQLLRSRPQRHLSLQPQRHRCRWLLVRRHAALVPRRTAGHAHCIHLLARHYRRDRRQATLLLHDVRRQVRR
jgi:hypothetical protein